VCASHKKTLSNRDVCSGAMAAAAVAVHARRGGQGQAPVHASGTCAYACYTLAAFVFGVHSMACCGGFLGLPDASWIMLHGVFVVHRQRVLYI
jgi:hypothetical protein